MALGLSSINSWLLCSGISQTLWWDCAVDCHCIGKKINTHHQQYLNPFISREVAVKSLVASLMLPTQKQTVKVATSNQNVLFSLLLAHHNQTSKYLNLTLSRNHIQFAITKIVVQFLVLVLIYWYLMHVTVIWTLIQIFHILMMVLMLHSLHCSAIITSVFKIMKYLHLPVVTAICDSMFN